MIRKFILPLILIFAVFSSCSEAMPDINAEEIILEIVESIDWDELKSYAKDGYDALIERFPALKGENVKAFLKENGLNLLNKYIQSTDAETRENARKLGEILKILNPELSDEVDAILSE